MKWEPLLHERSDWLFGSDIEPEEARVYDEARGIEVLWRNDDNDESVQPSGALIIEVTESKAVVQNQDTEEWVAVTEYLYNLATVAQRRVVDEVITRAAEAADLVEIKAKRFKATTEVWLATASETINLLRRENPEKPREAYMAELAALRALAENPLKCVPTDPNRIRPFSTTRCPYDPLSEAALRKVLGGSIWLGRSIPQELCDSCTEHVLLKLQPNILCDGGMSFIPVDAVVCIVTEAPNMFALSVSGLEVFFEVSVEKAFSGETIPVEKCHTATPLLFWLDIVGLVKATNAHVARLPTSLRTQHNLPTWIMNVYAISRESLGLHPKD